MRFDKNAVLRILAERGLTKSEFADLCGVSRQFISAVLNRGTCEPRTLGKLAAGLSVPVSELTGGEKQC